MHRAGMLALVALTGCGGAQDSTATAPIENRSAAPAAVPEPVEDASGLTLTSLEPAHGDAGGGTYVLVKGRGFLADGPRMAKVYFGSRQAVVVRFASDGELIVEAPSGVAGEAVDVLVLFEPGGTRTLPKAFTFVQP